MNGKEWKQHLVGYGLCDKYLDSHRWPEDATIPQLMDIAMSLDGMYFIGSTEMPKPHQLALFFHGMTEDAGMFIKKVTPIDITFKLMKVHFLDCFTTVNVEDGYIGYIFVSNNSDITLNVGKKCDIYLHIFDGSYVEVNNKYNSEVTIKHVKRNGNEV